MFGKADKGHQYLPDENGICHSCGESLMFSGHVTLPDFGNFIMLLHEKMAKGAREYGDASFERSPQQLVSEIEAELLDIVGWGYILWRRLRILAGRLPSVPDSQHT